MAELTQSMSGRETPGAILIGTCKQCGVCCERILLVEPDPVTGAEVDASESTTPAIVEIRRHLVVAYRRADGIPVWRCTHLQWYDGKASCGIYQDRPQICRDFPLNNEGELPPGCSYRFVKRSRMLPVIEGG
jgi:Fe-S-cluster containining protein